MAGNVVTKRVALVGDDGRFDDSMAPAVVVEAVGQTAAAATAAATSASDALRYRDEALGARVALVLHPDGTYTLSTEAAQLVHGADGTYTLTLI